MAGGGPRGCGDNDESSSKHITSLASFGKCTAAVVFLECCVPCIPMWSIWCTAGSNSRGGGGRGEVGGRGY